MYGTFGLGLRRLEFPFADSTALSVLSSQSPEAKLSSSCNTMLTRAASHWNTLALF